ncbi:DUF445 domain-containing protein [filamentous cyanobacterium LEGE 11480]|uniref:DUF445 domain-containing protein n=1 Tax=Romeriopsis navalis LEGE 11480 TaxID=2777977 RepID=A0A928Z5R8_9CYAN|nr:DUF445 family protein [Romeriopsis navalis]MBE9031550.1 DUF445 domain-containing protein [Romeriopsis navalis LEGE 11480]
MNIPNFWLYLVPPVVGAAIGYFTNDIAIRMLFRPYKAKYIGTWRLPLTPGVIPRNQSRLAKRVADSITGSLLTPEEIEHIARRLLQVERVQSVILWLLELALDQMKENRQQNTAKILGNILGDLFGESLPKLLKNLAEQEDFLEAQLNQIFDQVLLEFRLDAVQSEKLADWLLAGVMTPDILRLWLVDFLTDRNIATIDERFRARSSGTYWVVANLFGLRNSLLRLRSFCLDEPQASDAIIQDLIQALGISKRIQQLAHDFSLQNLPIATVRPLRKNLRETVRRYFQQEGAGVLQGLSASVDWEEVALVIMGRLQRSPVMAESLQSVSYELARILERYLEKDLEAIVAQALPILQIDQVIYDRVMATSPAEMELAINDLVRTELQAIVNLGGILGLIVGALQSVILWLR